MSELSVAALVDAAGVAEDDDLPFSGNLARLVDSCLATAALNPPGTLVLAKTVVRRLRNLAAIRAYVAAQPEAAVRPLGAPLVVTGLPRTGTTLLHNLLALDPAHRVVRFWEALRPVPAGDGSPSVEERRGRAERWLDGFYRLVPEFRAIHGTTPDGPEECDALLQNTFASQHFDDMFDARDYAAWLAAAPLAEEYDHYALQLRVLSAASPVRTAWALKSPSHLGHLDSLRRALPGCTILVCHRDPREAVASYASLIHTLRRAYSDGAPAAVAGRQALGRSATAMGRAMAARATIGEEAFVDVSYPQLVGDPVATLAAVYRRLGRRFDAGLAEAIGQRLAAHPQHEHGAHRYDLARFGLTAAAVDDAFAGYLDRFGALCAG